LNARTCVVAVAAGGAGSSGKGGWPLFRDVSRERGIRVMNVRTKDGVVFRLRDLRRWAADVGDGDLRVLPASPRSPLVLSGPA
jgi:hypothetical protein